MQHTDFSNSAASAYLVDVLKDESKTIKRKVYSQMQYFNEVMKELRNIQSSQIHINLVQNVKTPYVSKASELINTLLMNISVARRREEIELKKE